MTKNYTRPFNFNNKKTGVLSMTKNYTVLRNAYNNCGDYIGSPAQAEQLFKKGINPELINDSYKVCSIGFSKTENKWYGWSHRAISGFSIGSKVRKGDIAYVSPNEEDFLDDCKDFWSDPESHINITAKHGKNETKPEVPSDEEDILPIGIEQGVWIKFKYSEKIKNEELRGKKSSIFTPYPETWGRGEWQAKTLEDAKLMAIDFAEDVS